MSDNVIITCALTGVLTDPRHHPVLVTPEEMAREARAAFDAGASIMHVHRRQQAPGRGHLPSWDPGVAAALMTAIRDRCRDGRRAASNGALVDALAREARAAGRDVVGPAEARTLMGLGP